jgi:hypothetical protein
MSATGRLVESPNFFLEIIKGMRGSPSMESPGKIRKIKALRERITKKVSLRNIDLVFPDNDTKMLSHNLYFPKAQGKWNARLV